jgi:hypothetical protein
MSEPKSGEKRLVEIGSLTIDTGFSFIEGCGPETIRLSIYSKWGAFDATEVTKLRDALSAWLETQPKDPPMREVRIEIPPYEVPAEVEADSVSIATALPLFEDP